MTTPDRDTGPHRELTHDFDPRAPETFTSAHALYKDMRTHCPVAHSDTYDGGFWALFRYEDVKHVLEGRDLFTTSVQNTVPKFAFTGRRPPLHFDPPEHTAYWRVINRFFARDKMAALEPSVREHAVRLLQPLIEAGEGDVSVDYAQKFPAHVFAAFFNLPTGLAELIKEISAEYVAAIQVVDTDNVVRLSRRLYEIAQAVIDERRTHPTDPGQDLTSALMAAEYEGSPLPPDMVLGCVRQLLVTGMVAPSVFIGNMFVHLSGDPGLAGLLRADPSRIPAAVEEFLRLYGPYRGMAWPGCRCGSRWRNCCGVRPESRSAARSRVRACRRSGPCPYRCGSSPPRHTTNRLTCVCVSVIHILLM